MDAIEKREKSQLQMRTRKKGGERACYFRTASGKEAVPKKRKQNTGGKQHDSHSHRKKKNVCGYAIRASRKR